MFHKVFHNVHNASLRQAETAAFLRAQNTQKFTESGGMFRQSGKQRTCHNRKIMPAFDRLRHRRYVGSGGQR